MARLIYAEQLKKSCSITGGFSDYDVVMNLKTLECVIDSQPTVDAVEVVRCRDCKYLVIIPFRNTYYCEKFLYKVSENGFCSYGAKMDGGMKDEMDSVQ